VSCSGSGRGIDGVTILGEELSTQDEVVTAIDGTLVAVVLLDSPVDEHPCPPASDIGVPYIHSPSPPPPESSCAVGLALVRSIDVQRGIIMLLCPALEDSIREWAAADKKVLLVRGRIELPVWELIAGVDFEEEGDVPWISCAVGTGGIVGGGVWRVRRNVMRRGQVGWDLS
jgi:polynucleotide 5'-hydroxyl-kinase GRC3/NOL9